MNDWTTLHALPNGAMFETEDGIRAVKSEYRYPSGGIECVLLASGEYAHFAQDVADPEASARAHNATRVRPLQIAPPPAPGALVTAEELAEVERLISISDRFPVTFVRGALDLLPRLAAEVRRLTASLDEALEGEKLSEEQTSALWHAVAAAANGADIEEHLRLLSAMGIDAEPVKTWARLSTLLRDAQAANEQLRGRIADERQAHAAALAAVQAHAAEVEAAYGTRASEAITAQARTATLEQRVRELEAEVARLRGQEPSR